MERGKMSSAGRGAKSKVPQHPQDIFALGTKSTVVVSRDSEKRNIHKPSTSGVERKREPAGFSQPPSKRSRIGSPAESVGGTSLEVEPVDLVPNVLQALDTHNSDKLLGLLTGSIRLLKTQRSKPDPILCMSMLYLTKIRPNMFAHEVVTQSLCTLLKREQGAAFKNKGNPLVFVLACNMLYAGHKDSNNWPDTFIKVYIEDALNERWWVECSWCKCLVENIVTAFGTKQPPPHLIPSDNTLGTMSPSGSGSPLMGSTDEDTTEAELEYTVFPRYSSSYETVEALVLEAIKDQIQRRAAPDAIGKGFLKLLSATCGFPEIRMISASRLEGWLHSGKLWRAAQELLAYVCCNAEGGGPTAQRDHDVLAQLARMRLKTKPLQQAYHNCLREMVSESPALLRSVVTHTIYNELSNVRSPNNMAVLCALIQAQPQLVPTAMAATYQELLLRPEEYLRPLRALTRECVRAARADAHALLPLARGLAAPPPHEPPQEVRERAFSSLADLFCCCCLVTALHSKHVPEYRQQVCAIQAAAVGWLLDAAMPLYRPSRHDFQLALNKIMFVESAETYSKVDNWPPESERALTYRLCCEAPLPQNTLLRLIFIGLSKEIPVAPTEVFELVEVAVRRAAALPPDEMPLQVDKHDLAPYLFQLCQFHPPDNMTLPPGYTPPSLAITSLYWRAWVLLTLMAAHNPHTFAERAAATYPTLRALCETCITGKPSIEWNASTAAESERVEAERAAILQLETHLATASNAKLPVTEHSSRLLSQLTILDPTGPARKPPQTVIDTLHQLNTQMRLGKLLCRQPALLLELVERHGTRRAMPWLHHLLRHDQLELSVLPVQCLCEFLSAGVSGAGTSSAEAGGKAGELCAHLRRTVHDTEEGARAVLHYYMHRLAHHHKATRSSASRGLKLVLTQSTDETIEMDYNTDVSPEEWLDLLWDLQHWEAIKEEVVMRIRAACLVECIPRHLAAYIAFLAKYVTSTPDADHTDIALDLSQVLMERTTVMGWVLPLSEARDPPPDPTKEPLLSQHAALHKLTQILYTHMYKVRASATTEEETAMSGGESEEWAGGERVTLVWPSGRRNVLHILLAHAHLKLLCYGPSIFDTNQEMYSWLQSIWVGNDAPQAFLMESSEEAVLLPDWLRLHMVRSARPALLEAGLRGLPAHKLALFIQTFGMPVASMSALLSALDACPAGAIVRLAVERAYMAQLLVVQRSRGATGGSAFAAALRLHHTPLPPDENLFEDPALPEETDDPWSEEGRPSALQIELVPSLLATAFTGISSFRGDLDSAFTQLISALSAEVERMVYGPCHCPYYECVMSYLRAVTCGGAAAAGLARRPALAAPLLRALIPAAAKNREIVEIAQALLRQYKCLSGPVVWAARALAEGGRPSNAASPQPSAFMPHSRTKEHLIAALEASTASTLEALGNSMIEQCNTQLMVDVISTVLEKHQQGRYEIKVKSEGDVEDSIPHVFSSQGLGCGLLLDWLADLQRETAGDADQTDRQMRLMFGEGGARWRAQLVAVLAHRASWRTLHNCLERLLATTSGWSPSTVLNFAETLTNSPRVWQGRDKATPKHYTAEDMLQLTHHQLEVLVRYIIAEAEEAEKESDIEGARKRIETRLPLLLRCCRSAEALLAAALPAAQHHPLLMMLLYMKVPKVLQLLMDCEALPMVERPLKVTAEISAVSARSTSATDSVSHCLLTAIAAAAQGQGNAAKLQRMEAGIRAVWCRVEDAGGRGLGLAGGLLRAAARRHRHHTHLLPAVEMLSDRQLAAHHNSEEVENILESFMTYVSEGGAALGGRVCALLTRYLACRPHRAAALLHKHADTIQSVPAFQPVRCSAGGPERAPSPPHALLKPTHTPDDCYWQLQELEAWGNKEGGAWGGVKTAQAILLTVAPLAASPHAQLRTMALSLLAKLLPAVIDTTPGLEALQECLDSNQPEVVQSALDKLPDILVGIQEHAARLLMRVFELGVTSRHPADTCIAKCVATLNLHRGC